MQLHLVHPTEGRARVSLTSKRLPAEPFTIHVEGPAHHAEKLITSLLCDAILFRLDRLASMAFDIEPRHRHFKQDSASDRCMWLVIHLTQGRVVPGPEEVCNSLLIGLPAFLYMIGNPTSPGYQLRKREYDRLQSMLAVLKLRMDAPGPSCHHCLHPDALGHSAKCTTNTATAA